MVGWHCDDPCTMREFIARTANADEPTGSVKSKGTCFRVDNCKQEPENQYLKQKLKNFTLLTG